MTTSQLHIALLAFPFGSHATPLLTLVQKLSPFLPSNTLFSFFNTSQSNSSIFSKFSKPENIKIYNVWDGVIETNGTTPIGREAIELFINATPSNFEKVMKMAEEESGVKFSCILSDAFLWFSCKLAEKMNVPWIAFWTAGSGSLSVHLYTDLIRSNEETLSTIPGFSSTLKISDMPPEVVAENLEGPMPSMLYNMALNLHKATAVVLNSFEELDPIINNDLESKLQKVLNIGPLVLQSSKKVVLDVNSDESGCIFWLEKQKEKSVVYLSFGTVTTLPPNEIVAVAEALEAKRVPFLWSLRENGVKILPKGFLERTKEFGKIVSWAPQLEILAHSAVGVFVTHCGWNSILEGISYGVPMICRPFFGDQKLNSRMVESVWQIGLQIEGGIFTKSGTMSALDAFFSEDKGKVLRQNVEGLKERAIEAVKSDGSPTKNFKDLMELVK
ncbi:anthocyanidin 3-O-glucosyltransferase-like precursor [Nicotiana tabacum]|uniref:Glycosyltransferase n=2 Tax=Nicotiana TaxID=4085 RepID=J7MDG9_TOBAC|nr:anthocyanidin 3-O-glucosyltransferase-like precursor [Nicotiana tabacum]XP_009772078.1 PREDICTED: anthocyanidin 3-O-glucosyltransferase-like [Nicotiana sylvestris]WIW42726.1 UDP-glycosyltransferase [Nicotiana tabacum]BAM37964.1 flavonoid 3-O-glucosyltransferase [Nicotiana tabacum]